MAETILFVDDEPNVLEALQRQLRGRYAVETAAGGAAGLHALDTRGPFAVVVSDMRMPDVTGVRVLAHARVRQPAATRVLLTGHADLASAIEVVNQGNVFRFLTKPCPPGEMAIALDAAVAQHRLVVAERELLDQTLRGSVTVLGEVLALTNPAAFGQTVRVQQLLRSLAGRVEGADDWEVDVAAVLSRLGCVAVPEGVIVAAQRGAMLTPDDRRLLDGVPVITRQLLAPIPRLERVLEVIACLDKPFYDPLRVGQERMGTDLPPGARLLTVAFDYDTLVARGVPPALALDQLKSREGWYDPAVLTALGEKLRADETPEVREVPVAALARGMILVDNVYSDRGVLLLGSGTPITEPLKHRLETAAARGHTANRVRVLVPRDGPAQS